MKDLNAAFRTLRKKGLIARQNYKCCTSCAGAAIAYDIEQMLDKGKVREAIKGGVFYHKQAGEDRARRGQFYLSYGSIHTQKYGEVGLPTKEVGEMVVEALRDEGIPFEWDGSPNKCIYVIERPDPKRPAATVFSRVAAPVSLV